MLLLLPVVRAFYRIVVDYFNNASLAGIGYIFNRRYHWTERFFWFACSLVAWIFVVQLILAYMALFRKDTISIAVENVDTRTEPIVFPAVGVCELGYVRQVYPRLESFIEDLKPNDDVEYNYDVEDFLLRVIFHNLYNVGAMTSYCGMYEECEDCIKCPKDEYRSAAATIRANCTELFYECRWNQKPFDCCHYFKPIETTMGLCFLLNSVQTVDRNGEYWLPLEMDSEHPDGDLLLVYNRAVMNIVNDPLVRSVDIDVRRCLFPDELHLAAGNTTYRKYSYSVCVTECLKAIQLRVYNENSSVCDYKGMQCLDNSNLIAPPTKILQPWYPEGYPCPCTENEIRLVGRHAYDNDHDVRTVKLKLMIHPTQRYRRQIVREGIDVVVSIGGILGLFTGASILSIVEFFYFFTVRFISYTAYGSDCETVSNEDTESSADEREERNVYSEIS
uniref:Sodium channel protein Nach n=1 Tax=Anopheles culicifacies TaxID=139723 RepID=A0A182MWU8_9DIPT